MSRTSKTGTPSPLADFDRGTRRRPSRPWPTASARKSWASNRSPTSATNRSPGSIVRVSVHTRPNIDGPRGRFTDASARERVGDAVHRPERRSSRPSGCAVLIVATAPLCRRQLVHDDSLIERQFGRAADLIGLVPLPGQDDRRRAASRSRARARSPRVDPRSARDCRVRHPRFDVVENRLGILGARIVARHDRDVRLRLGDRAHLGTLAAVAIAAASKDDDQPFRARTDARHRARARARRACARSRAARPALSCSTSRRPGTCGIDDRRSGDAIRRHAERVRRRRRAERVDHVEVADERKPHLVALRAEAERQLAAARTEANVLGVDFGGRHAFAEPDAPPVRSQRLHA